jgi:hypothetical protein
VGRRHARSRGHSRFPTSGTAKAPPGENASARGTPDPTAAATQWRDRVYDSRVHDTACGAWAWRGGAVGCSYTGRERAGSSLHVSAFSLSSFSSLLVCEPGGDKVAGYAMQASQTVGL